MHSAFLSITYYRKFVIRLVLLIRLINWPLQSVASLFGGCLVHCYLWANDVEGFLGMDACDLQRLRARDVAQQSTGLKAHRCSGMRKHYSYRSKTPSGFSLCHSPPQAAPCAQWVCGSNRPLLRCSRRLLWPLEPGALRDPSAASATHWPVPLLPCEADRMRTHIHTQKDI